MSAAIKSLAFIALLSGPAAAETLPLRYHEAVRDYDTATLSMEGLGGGTLVYDNNAARASKAGRWTLTDGLVRCDLRVVVAEAEVVTVWCRAPYVAEPREAEIPDGESFTFTIMFLGG